ncbi:hypothetical protein CPn_1064 [Chlamydia pneumoniae CWL029]|uniref:Lipoprotein n=3 Tax=Chlamydia pneumoniae TaxID=83558 RepID=Q9Z6J5_CHLPN|nr:hypothetical protein CPn_1064 [Chlamydia pneumoniae CWL029]AAF38584.1 hypothetical protein CP_0785 [Chlamydia pneumoniae AR39]BAA99271.1 hypothetical protein [Chlamydia pneumoniae J138]
MRVMRFFCLFFLGFLGSFHCVAEDKGVDLFGVWDDNQITECDDSYMTEGREEVEKVVDA